MTIEEPGQTIGGRGVGRVRRRRHDNRLPHHMQLNVQSSGFVGAPVQAARLTARQRKKRRVALAGQEPGAREADGADQPFAAPQPRQQIHRPRQQGIV